MMEEFSLRSMAVLSSRAHERRSRELARLYYLARPTKTAMLRRLEFSLIDVYRNLNPNKRLFTYESKALKLSSRIDFYLVSQPLANRVSHHGNFSFHRA